MLLTLLLLSTPLILPITSSSTSHLYGIKTWRIVEAVISAYRHDWQHSVRTLNTTSTKCSELPYTMRLLNIDPSGCTPGRVNRVVHRWLNGNRRNWNTDLETLIDEYVLGDMLFSVDSLYSLPMIQKLGLSATSGYWDSWPSKQCYDNIADRLDKFLQDLDQCEVDDGSHDLKLAKESLLFKVRLEVEEYRNWYVRNVDFVGVVTFYAGEACRVNIVDDAVAKGWVRRVQTFDQKIKHFEDFLKRSEPFYGPHHLRLMLETVESLRTTIENVKEGRFISCFWYQYTHNMGKDPPQSLVNSLTSAISSSFQPALERYLYTLEQSMNSMLSTRLAGPGVSGTPNGTEFYQHQILQHTTLDLSPDYIHRVGMVEVGKIKSEMREVVKKIYERGDQLVSPNWPMQKIFSILRHHDEFFYDITDEESVKESVRHILEVINRKMGEAFTENIIKEGRAGLNIETESGASMGYYVESISPETNGTFYIGTGGNLNKLKMRALVCHEAIPGHHLQTSLLKSHPIFSKLSNARVQYSVSTEGWSLYSEKLCGEMGVMDVELPDLPSRYSTQYYHLGRLSMQLVRAVRLVVETGIHAKYWSRDRAVTFFERNTDLRSDLIQQEIDRYITNPGQALSYYVGLMEVLKLREDVKKVVGEGRFDVRQFHSNVLSAGSVPIPTLKRHVMSLYSDQEV